MKTINIDSCEKCPLFDNPNCNQFANRIPPPNNNYENWIHPDCTLEEHNMYAIEFPDSKESASILINNKWELYVSKKWLDKFMESNKQDQEKSVVEEIYNSWADNYKKLKQVQKNMEDTRNAILGITQEEHNANLKEAEERAREEERQCLDTLQQFVQEKITPTYKLLIGKNVDEAILYYIECLKTEIDGYHEKEKKGFYDSFKELTQYDIEELENIYMKLYSMDCYFKSNFKQIPMSEREDFITGFRTIIDKLKGDRIIKFTPQQILKEWLNENGFKDYGNNYLDLSINTAKELIDGYFLKNNIIINKDIVYLFWFDYTNFFRFCPDKKDDSISKIPLDKLRESGVIINSAEDYCNWVEKYI